MYRKNDFKRRHDLANEEFTLPPFGTVRTCTCNGLSIRFFDTSPEADGIPFLFIHGYSGTGYEARRLAKKMPEGSRIIAPDLPGMGFSDKPETPYSIGLFVDTVNGLMEQLDLEKAVFIGHSLGGAIAVTFADIYPEKVEDLILIAPYGIEGEQGSLVHFLSRIYPLVDLAMSIVNRLLFRKVMETVVFYSVKNIPPELEEYLAESLLIRGGNLALAAITKEVMNSTTIEEHLARLERYVLIIWGRQDRVLSFAWAKKFQEILPLSQLVPIARCGHMPHIEHPGVTASAIMEFLRRKNGTGKDTRLNR